MQNHSKKTNYSLSIRSYIIIGSIVFILVLATAFISKADIKTYAWAYNNKEVLNKAWNIASKNQNVLKATGTPYPIEAIAITEGEVHYANDTAIKSTITVKGIIGKAKMDVVAHKQRNTWNYDTINIRIASPKKAFLIIP